MNDLKVSILFKNFVNIAIYCEYVIHVVYKVWIIKCIVLTSKDIAKKFEANIVLIWNRFEFLCKMFG